MRATEDTNSNSQPPAQLRALPINKNGHFRMPPQPAGFGAALFDLSARMASRERATARPRFDMKLQRLAEIGDLILARTGERRLMTDDALHVALIAAHHCKAPEQAQSWINKWCPSLDRAAVEGIVAAAFSQPRKYRADTIARLLNVTFEERQRLGLCTIGACDIPKEERKARVADARREREAERARQVRREAGAVPRAQFIAESVSEQARRLGISRAALYRQRKRDAQKTAVSPPDRSVAPMGIPSIYTSNGPVRPVVSHIDIGRAAAYAADPVQIAYTRDLRAALSDQVAIPADTPLSAMGWKPRVVMAAPDPRLARIGALVAAQAAAHRIANSWRKAA